MCKYSKFTRFIENKDEIVLVNRKNGQWIKVPSVWKKLIDRCIQENISIEKFASYFDDSDNRDDFVKLCRQLEKHSFIVKKGCREETKLEKIQFAITERCNLNCIHCCYDADSQSKNNTDLDLDDVKKILDCIIQCNPDYITLSGGEPMIRKDFYEILEYLKNHYAGKITLSTNATLIKEKDIVKLIGMVDSFDISLDGYDEESCSIIRGKGIFNKVIDTVKKLVNEGAKNISISMVDIRNSKEDIKYFEELNEQLGTKPIVRVLCPIGRASSMESKLEYLEKTYLLKSTEIQDKKRMENGLICTNCGALYNQFFVNYDGSIYPCGLLIKEKYNIGNILSYNNFREFMDEGLEKSPLMKNVKMLEPDKLPKCRDCKVNYFCWSCLQEADMAIEDEQLIDKRCDLRREMLEKIVW